MQVELPVSGIILRRYHLMYGVVGVANIYLFITIYDQNPKDDL